MVHFDRVGRDRLLGRVKDGDLAIGGVGDEVSGEGGNAAVSGWIRRDEGSANDDGAPLGRRETRISRSCSLVWPVAGRDVAS
jgi:hypothetical protein